MTHARKSKGTTEEDYRFAPKASRRPSQSFTTNSRLCHGMLPSPRVNSTPWAAYSAKTVASGPPRRAGLGREKEKQVPVSSFLLIDCGDTKVLQRRHHNP